MTQDRHILEFFERGRHPIKYKYVCQTQQDYQMPPTHVHINQPFHMH